MDRSVYKRHVCKVLIPTISSVSGQHKKSFNRFVTLLILVHVVVVDNTEITPDSIPARYNAAARIGVDQVLGVVENLGDGVRLE